MFLWILLLNSGSLTLELNSPSTIPESLSELLLPEKHFSAS